MSPRRNSHINAFLVPLLMHYSRPKVYDGFPSDEDAETCLQSDDESLFSDNTVRIHPGAFTGSDVCFLHELRYCDF